MPVPGPTMMTGFAPILRQPEMLGRLDENGHGRGFGHAFGQERRGNAVALPSVRVVTQGIHRQMHLFRVRLQAGGNRVKPGLEFAQELDEFLRRKPELG